MHSILDYVTTCIKNITSIAAWIMSPFRKMSTDIHIWLPEFLIVSLEIIPFFIEFIYIFLINTRYSLIDFDVIFPIQTSKFIKLLNFESNLKKN